MGSNSWKACSHLLTLHFSESVFDQGEIIYLHKGLCFASAVMNGKRLVVKYLDFISLCDRPTTKSKTAKVLEYDFIHTSP